MNSKESNAKELPYGSGDLTLALPAPQTSSSAYGASEFTAEDYRTALRMLVGAALEGSDELRYRLKMWLVAIQKREQESGDYIPRGGGIGRQPAALFRPRALV